MSGANPQPTDPEVVNPPAVADLVAAIPVPAIVLRRDGTVIAVNDPFLEEFAAHDAYGETVVGARLSELGDSLDATVLDPLTRAVACERLALRGALLWKHGTRQGERFDVAISRVDGSHALVTFRPTVDEESGVAERRRLKRLECLGMAASGVAHDLNNHLAATLNVTTLLAEELGPDSPHARALQIILGSSSEATDLARKMLAFAGRGQPEVRRIDVEKLVQDAALLVRHELPRDGRIVYAFEADDRELFGDATQLQHAMLLLLLRAAKHLHPASNLEVASRVVDLAEPLAVTSRRSLLAGRYVAIEYVYEPADSSEADAAEDDVLRTADAIASEHGGAVRVERDGDRSRVRLLLALSGSKPRTRPAGPPAPHVDSPRTILVADDDPMVRDVAVAMIRRVGYQVVVAGGGIEAIEVVKRATPPVDLVVLDLVMNDLDGASAMREIRRIAPHVKVIVSSGFGTETHLGPDLPVDGILEKPYSMATLRQALQAALGPS